MRYRDHLALQTACLIQQNQRLKQQNAMLCDLIDRMDSMGELLFRMDCRHASSVTSVDQAGTRKRATKKRYLARQRSGK